MPDVIMTTRCIVPASLPFGGLGFDLAPVVARACLLACKHGKDTTAVEAKPLSSARSHAGYGLMLWLSRETGGS